MKKTLSVCYPNNPTLENDTTLDSFYTLKNSGIHTDYCSLEAGLAILKRYYNWLCNKSSAGGQYPRLEWKKEKSTLEKLLAGCKGVVSGVYNGTSREESIESILSLRSEIETYATFEDNLSTDRHIHKGYSQCEQQLAWELYKISRTEGKFDSVFYIASGGAEPALLFCALRGGIPIPIRYSRFGDHDRYVVLPADMPEEYIKEKVKGKRILVVDDFIMTGTSMLGTINYLMQYEPKTVYGCALKLDFCAKLKALRRLGFIADDSFPNTEQNYVFRFAAKQRYATKIKKLLLP
jgi:hypoxanthine phosphoribosyltransferase